MRQELDNLLMILLHVDIESEPDCEELGYLIHMLDRSNRRMIIGGYDDPEEYYRECLPADIFDLKLDDTSQGEIANRIVERVFQDPTRLDLIFLMSKIHPWIAILPLLRLIVTTGDRFNEETLRQANFSLDAIILDLHKDDVVQQDMIAFNLQPEIKAFVNRSLSSNDESVRELAERIQQGLESFGLEK